MKKKILVTGAGGQLATCLQDLAADASEFDFHFLSSLDLDITDEDSVSDVFQDLRPDFCVNAAAYTAVDRAEVEKDLAFAVNARGVQHLAEACKKTGALLIHVSTDYVFSGETEISYDEDNFTAPQTVYGASKREGELLALEANPKTIILRTSWLYSAHGKNFLTTMLRLFAEKPVVRVVADQFGQPTYAPDLAAAILRIIRSEKKTYGIFHFANYPETSWFGFAQKIAALSGSPVDVQPQKTADYPTPARRPVRSTMSLDKIEEVYGISPEYWENSLQTCLENLENA